MECGKTIICGYGLVGQNAARRILKTGVSLTVIDLVSPIVGLPSGMDFIQGDAADEEVIRSAGLEETASVVVATNSDVKNVFITLLVKEINPLARVMAVASDPVNQEKLYRAGANYVVSKSLIGGRMLAKHAIRPQIADFMDRMYITGGVEISQFVVPAGCSLIGRTLADSKIRDVAGVNVIAIGRRGATISSPSANTGVLEGDTLHIIGTSEQLKEFKNAFELMVKS
ncbi:MAG: hypothetical protein CVT48_01715 [Thermoplasmata archaeon HGW-Thermoplasmata-1]|nr:MAG: hypothetical protein CVT48_01715 [Thermoplasmata archaeon HGW-Thermoplasmata-1]